MKSVLLGEQLKKIYSGNHCLRICCFPVIMKILIILEKICRPVCQFLLYSIPSMNLIYQLNTYFTNNNRFLNTNYYIYS